MIRVTKSEWQILAPRCHYFMCVVRTRNYDHKAPNRYTGKLDKPSLECRRPAFAYTRTSMRTLEWRRMAWAVGRGTPINTRYRIPCVCDAKSERQRQTNLKASRSTRETARTKVCSQSSKRVAKHIRMNAPVRPAAKIKLCDRTLSISSAHLRAIPFPNEFH